MCVLNIYQNNFVVGNAGLCEEGDLNGRQTAQSGWAFISGSSAGGAAAALQVSRADSNYGEEWITHPHLHPHGVSALVKYAEWELTHGLRRLYVMQRDNAHAITGAFIISKTLFYAVLLAHSTVCIKLRLSCINA